jgi:sphingosine kinase
VRRTERAGHAREIAETAPLDSYDGLCVIGGDGTVHEAADGLMRRGERGTVPLGLIPAGSGNTMHQHLQCIDPTAAAERIIAGETVPLDVIRVTLPGETVHCVNIVGWAGVADINQTAERLRWLGPSRYAFAALWHILWIKHRRATITLDDRTIDDEFLFAIACNGKFTGKGMLIAPHAELGDGKMDVVVVRRASRRQLLALFRKIFQGEHLSMPFVEYHQVRRFSIASQTRDVLDLDGEMKGETPFEAEVLPGALAVFANGVSPIHHQPKN